MAPDPHRHYDYETGQKMIVGSIITGGTSMAAALLVVATVLWRLTIKIGVQNGRVGKLELGLGSHEQRVSDIRPYERLEKLEEIVGQLASDARLVKAIVGAGTVVAPVVYYLLSKQLGG